MKYGHPFFYKIAYRILKKIAYQIWNESSYRPFHLFPAILIFTVFYSSRDASLAEILFLFFKIFNDTQSYFLAPFRRLLGEPDSNTGHLRPLCGVALFP
jgi:hypothetical protein